MQKTSVLCVLSALTLCACDDNIDITRYSGYVQNCYHNIIEDKDNCTNSKRKIIKYCQCREEMELLVSQKKAEMQEAYATAYNSAVSMFGGLGWFAYTLGTMDDVANGGMWKELDEYRQKLYDNCAKDTGYTRIANCPKKEQITE